MRKFLSSVTLIGFLLTVVIGQKIPLQPEAVSPEGRNVDSMAIWIAPKPSDSLILITEKSGNEIMAIRADRTASLVRRFGSFRRPNGVIVIPRMKIGKSMRDVALTTERDGNRISLFSIPDFQPLGSFGEEIQQPMGITYVRDGDGALIFVVSKRAEGDDKIIRYRITLADGMLRAERQLSFGHELTPNQETVFADESTGLLYAADESAQNIKVYDLSGRLLTTFGDGIFQGQVEGIAIARCGKKSILVASDQLIPTELEFFELPGYKHLATVITSVVKTDGIALTQHPLPDFPRGLLVAQTDPNESGGLRVELFRLDKLFDAGSIKCRSK